MRNETTLLACVASIDRQNPSGPESSAGLHLYAIDADRGEVELIESTGGIGNPMSIAISPDHRMVYAVSDVDADADGNSGRISTFALDPTIGSLELVDQRSTGGNRPLFVSTDRRSRAVFVANLGSGSTAMLPLAAGGLPRSLSDVQQHTGSSVHPDRQRGPHVHCVLPDTDTDHLLAADLGADRVSVYDVDYLTGRLMGRQDLAVPRGAGPRHLAFHPSLPCVYVVCELASLIMVCSWSPRSGTLAQLEVVSTLPADFAGASTAADVQVSPNGRFVYASNRGHDSLVVFRVVDEGRLELVEHTPTGRAPQIIGLSDDGALLVAGVRDAGKLGLWRVDHSDGRLASAGDGVDVPVPVCVRVFTP